MKQNKSKYLIVGENDSMQPSGIISKHKSLKEAKEVMLKGHIPKKYKGAFIAKYPMRVYK